MSKYQRQKIAVRVLLVMFLSTFAIFVVSHCGGDEKLPDVSDTTRLEMPNLITTDYEPVNSAQDLWCVEYAHDDNGNLIIANKSILLNYGYDLSEFSETPFLDLPLIEYDEAEPEFEEFDGDNAGGDTWYMYMTDYERKLFAATIQLEGSIESIECQKAIGSAIIHRMNWYNQSIDEIVLDVNQFAVAPMVLETEPEPYFYAIADSILEFGPNTPPWVIYFRSGHYHSFGVPYMNLGNTYFSYSQTIKDALDK